MTELPEEVRRELEELYLGQAVPANAVTVLQLSEQMGGSVAMWGRRLKGLVSEGTWMRSRRTGSQAYWYWKIEDEA